MCDGDECDPWAWIIIAHQDKEIFVCFNGKVTSTLQSYLLRDSQAEERREREKW